MRWKRSTASTSQPPVCAMVSIISTPGKSGWPGKWPSNTGLSLGTMHCALTVRASGSSATILSTIWKYSSRMPASGGLRGDQFIDVGAEIAQHEVFVCRNLPLVHFLGPFLQRHLDAERFVDGERDIEKIQAVDTEIVDCVALRRDLLTRNVACFGNDSGDGIEGRRHRSVPANKRRALTPKSGCRKSAGIAKPARVAATSSVPPARPS